MGQVHEIVRIPSLLSDADLIGEIVSCGQAGRDAMPGGPHPCRRGHLLLLGGCDAAERGRPRSLVLPSINSDHSPAGLGQGPRERRLVACGGAQPLRAARRQAARVHQGAAGRPSGAQPRCSTPSGCSQARSEGACGCPKVPEGRPSTHAIMICHLPHTRSNHRMMCPRSTHASRAPAGAAGRVTAHKRHLALSACLPSLVALPVQQGASCRAAPRRR